MRAEAATAVILVWASIASAGATAARAPEKRVFPLQAAYEGTVELEADYHRPGETRTYRSEQRFYCAHDGRVRMDWTTWAEGDTARIPESFLVSGDSVFHRTKPGARWALSVGRRAHDNCLQALAGFPWELERWASGHKLAWHGELTRKSAKPDRYFESWGHPRLGDVCDSIAYSWNTGGAAPRGYRMVLHERDLQWRMTEHLVSSSSEATPESLLRTPSIFDPPSGAPDKLIDAPKLVPLAPGVWSADMDDIGSRTLIVEFVDYLAMIEFAVGSPNGERLADAARRRWPQKPIRYALFSHYHPHYIGGIRAMIAEGATVVTTPGLETFVRRIATRRFTIEADRLARSPRPLKIQTFSDRFELADSTNDLVAFNYGDRSKHTDEFVVFWLPRTKLMFESSLGWYRAADGRVKASARTAPLLAWSDEQKLDVERVVQSWPMRETPAEMSRAELDSLVHASRR